MNKTSIHLEPIEVRKLNIHDGDIIVMGTKPYYSQHMIQATYELMMNTLAGLGIQATVVVGVPHDMEFQVLSKEEYDNREDAK